MAKDPVCGMDVDEKKAAATSEYKKKNYYFCEKVSSRPSLPSAMLRTGLIATSEPRDVKSHLTRIQRSVWERRKKRDMSTG